MRALAITSDIADFMASGFFKILLAILFAVTILSTVQGTDEKDVEPLNNPVVESVEQNKESIEVETIQTSSQFKSVA